MRPNDPLTMRFSAHKVLFCSIQFRQNVLLAKPILVRLTPLPNDLLARFVEFNASFGVELFCPYCVSNMSHFGRRFIANASDLFVWRSFSTLSTRPARANLVKVDSIICRKYWTAGQSHENTDSN